MRLVTGASGTIVRGYAELVPETLIPWSRRPRLGEKGRSCSSMDSVMTFKP